MKKVSVLLLTLLILLTASVPALAATENASYLEPKFIFCAGDANSGGYYPVLEPRLLSLLRTAANDAYKVDSDSGEKEQQLIENMSALGFSDCYSMTVDGSCATYHPTDSTYAEERKEVVMVSTLFTAVRNFTVNGAQKKVLLISIRGTASITDAMTDMIILDKDGFHAGFYNCAEKAYNGLCNQSIPGLGMSFQDYLQQASDPDSGCYILVTGHSLGAGAASILTANFLNEATHNVYNTLCCNFASPKICSAERAASLQDGNILSIINNTDIVPDVGYLLTAGVQLGHPIYGTIGVEDADADSILDILAKHSINYVYKSLVEKINAAPVDYYHYAYSTTEAPERINISTPSLAAAGNHIPTQVEGRFDPYELILGPTGNLNLQGNSLRGLRVIGDGSLLYVIGENELRENLIVENGSLVLGSGDLTVKGDLRVQAVTAEGFGGGSGRVIMEDADGHLTVFGDTYFQGARSSLEAGMLELKGDLSVLPSTGEQAEIIFSADGTHEVLLSGDKAQTVYFAPPVSESSFLFSSFNILRSDNSYPIIAPEAICMRQIPYDLDFQGELILDGLGEWGLEVPVGSDVCITADHVRLLDAACPKVYGDLRFDCGVSGGRIDVGKYEGPAAHLTVVGNLVGTHLYFNSPMAVQEHNLVIIEGDYIPQGTDLCLCNGWLQVKGDFVCRTEQENGGFLPSAPQPISIYEGARVNILGDLLLAAADELQDIPFTAECTVVLYGDLLQSPSGEKSQMIYGIHNLVLAGSSLQTVDASMMYFSDITLANTSCEGVVFNHPLYGLSGVFNAYGRMDGTMTPYRFPKGAQPTYKDSDHDGIADCLDPDPRSEQRHPGLIGAISDGYRDGSVIRFLYNTPSDSAVEEGSVFLALYSGGQMVGLQSIHLIVAARDLRELEIDLSEMPHVDRIKIMQFDLAGSRPVWTAAAWNL